MSRQLAETGIVDAHGALIVGAGLAGLFTALKMQGPVTILSAASLGAGASSSWAQGGIAAALGSDDSPDLHARDTISAGSGTVDAKIAHLIADEAAARIEDLAKLGVPFDRDSHGRVQLGREAAHSRNRIVRVKGDRAGAAIMASLIEAVKLQPRIRVIEGLIAFDLAMDHGTISGVFAHAVNDRHSCFLIRATSTVFALGGVGGLFEITTNPPQARGQGLGMAARAGAEIADPEFVQFHPTAMAIGSDPAPLATEALRGEGAILINDQGQRFMTSLHADAELAPRDIVARAIFREIRSGRKVFLDATQALGSHFPESFPTVYSYCIAAGIDPRTTPIPVAPAAHYHMGGISVDEHARTTLPGLWAVGECASTGAHGANRLASNSLLEAIVFGARAANDVSGHQPLKSGLAASSAAQTLQPNAEPADISQLRRLMTRHVGLERTASGLSSVLQEIAVIGRQGETDPDLQNMAAASTLIAGAALARRESRGGHFRSDFPQADPNGATRTFVTLDQVRAAIGEIAITTDDGRNQRMTKWA